MQDLLRKTGGRTARVLRPRTSLVLALLMAVTAVLALAAAPRAEAAAEQPPATPSSVTVTRGDGTLTASWGAVDGATSYHVTYSSDGKSSWSLAALNHSSTSITIGADNSKTYTVGVRARNDSGDSGWRNSPSAGPYTPPRSEPTPEPEPEQPPARPSSVAVTRSDGALTASWGVVDGATSYHVTYSSDGKGSWSLAALNHSSTSITISADNTKTYVVGVRARNDSGDSGWRNSPAAGPLHAGAAVEPQNTGLSFNGATISDQSWTKDEAITTLNLPQATGGSGSLTYTLSPTLPSGLSFDATARTVTGTPTATAAQATYRYSATDGTDTAMLSFKAEVLESAAIGCSSLKSSVSVSASTNPSHSIYALAVSINSANGSADQAKLEWRQKGTSTWSERSMNANSSKAAIESLSSSTTYEVMFAIRFNSSHLDFGQCGWKYSDVAEGTTASPAVPHKPAAPTVTQNSTTPKTQLDVAWTATYGAPKVSGYHVEYRKKGETNWTGWGSTFTVLTTTITGLEEGTTYEVQVQARNSQGTGSWSDSGEGTTEDKNVGPEFSADTATRSIAENSAADANVGGAFTATDTESDTLTYSLSGTDASSFSIDSSTGQIKVGSGTTLDFESSTTSYSVTVGVSDLKDSSGTADTVVDDTITVTISVTDVNEPPPKMNPSASQQASSPKYQIAVRWQPPTMTGKPAITHFDLRYKKKSDSTWTQKDDLGKDLLYYAITGLTYKTDYQVEMRAANDEGDGTWSDTDEVKTHDQTEPEFSSDSVTLSIAEDADVGDDVGKVAATDDDNDALYYSVSGTGASDFSVGQYNGTIDVAAALDYEATSSYTLTLSVKDKKASDDTADDVVDDTITVTINVTDVNEPPPKMAAPTVVANSTTPATKIDVSWTAPTMTGKPAVTDYDVQYRKTGDSTWISHSFTGTGTSTTLTGLTSGKTYQVQVRAGNHEGDGPWSDSGSAITDGSAVSRSVAENSAAGTSVGAAVTATANPNGYTLTHSLSGTDASRFSIGSSTGQITVGTGTTLDYETKTSYSVVVTVRAAAAQVQSSSLSPNAPGSYVIPVTINVTDVNEAPAFSDATATRSIAENSTSGTNIGAVVTGTDPDGVAKYNTLTYSLSGTDASKFDIGNSSGQITVKSALDYETKTSYSVTVGVSDGKNASGSADTTVDDTIAVTINVTDVNEAPAFSAATAARNVAENSTAGTSVGAVVTATDPDGDTLTYSLSGTDASKFSISSSSGQITVKTGTTLDHEAKWSYSVTVGVSDGKDASGSADTTTDDTVAVTIFATDVNEPPPKLSAPTVAANSTTPGTKIDVSWTAPTSTQMTGKPAVDDYDVQYRKTGDSTWVSHSFTGTGTSTTIAGLTSGKTYQVQVRAGNHEGTSSWSLSGVAITDGSAVSRSVAENSAAGTSVGAAVAAKANSAYTYTYSLDGTDKGKFSIGSSTGQITVGTGTTLDYETKQSYSVTVKVTVAAASQGANAQSLDPNAPGSYVIPVTINVTDVNEKGEFSDIGLLGATREIAENSDSGDNVGKAVTATDPDGDTLTYSLAGTDADKFDIGSSTGQITVGSGTDLDYETKVNYLVTVQVSDGKDGDGDPDTGVDASALVNINVTDVSEPPAKLAAPTVAKNGTTPTTKLDVSWTAPDMTGKPAVTDYDVQYRKTGDSTWVSHSFTGTGTSTTLTGLTAGKSYEVQVRATNDEGSSSWSDSGSAITDADAVSRSVAENSAAGTSVGAAVTATANPNGYTLTHSLSGTDAAKFDIDSSTGQLQVKSTLDYETRTSYSVVVTVRAAAAQVQSSSLSPNAPGSYVIPVTINVTDVNEIPEFPTATAARSVAENSAAGTNIGAVVTATDPDGVAKYNTLTYSLSGTDAAEFDIDSSTGQITVKSALDHEAKWSYSVTVGVSDGKNASGTADTTVDDTVAVTIFATDVDEPPPALDGPSVSQNATTPNTELDVSWTAPDMTGKPAVSDYDVRYRKSSESTWTSHSFSGTGTSTTVTGLTQNTRYEVQVRAVNDEGEGPWSDSGSMRTQFLTSATLTVPENSPGGTAVSGSLPDLDDEGHTLTYTMTGNTVVGGSGSGQHDEFEVDSATGQVKVKDGAGLNYEAAHSHTIEITASHADKDDPEHDITNAVITVTIDIGDVNEPPEAPGKPTKKSATYTSLTATWDEPDMTGKPAVTQYYVRFWQKGSGVHLNVRTTTTNEILLDSITVYPGSSDTALKPGTAYEVEVRATNGEGTSAWSQTATLYTKARPVTLQQPPSPVTPPTPAPLTLVSPPAPKPTPTPVPTTPVTPAAPKPTPTPVPTTPVTPAAPTAHAHACAAHTGDPIRADTHAHASTHAGAGAARVGGVAGIQSKPKRAPAAVVARR